MSFLCNEKQSRELSVSGVLTRYMPPGRHYIHPIIAAVFMGST